jgi:acetyl-CoA acetyltransferase
MAQSRTGLEDLERALAASIARTETCVMDLNAARARIGLPPLAYRSAADAERISTSEMIIDAAAVRRGEAVNMAEAKRLRLVEKNKW